MMEQLHGASDLLLLPVLLLAAAVISVPLARLLRLSAIVAYLAAGVVIGPYGFALIRAPETIVTVSELGVVLPLFLIGLELEFSRLLALHRAIFGLGAAQLVATAAALAGLAYALGLTGWRGALIGGFALAMSATAIALKILEELSAPSRSCCSRICRSCRYWRCCRCSHPAPTAMSSRNAARSRPDRIVHRRLGGCRALSPQPLPAFARQHRRPRGDDGRRLAGGPRRRRPYAICGDVDGARRVSRRRDARRLELPT
jgi:Sodium/hydrogen exchanger family